MTPGKSRLWLGAALIAMGAGLALNSLLGPLVWNVVGYPVTPTMLNQTIGLDAVSLVLVAPLSFLAGALTLRHHPAGAVIALGPAWYTAYMFAQYVVGPDYLSIPVTLLLQLALFILGWTTGLMAWSRIPASDARQEDVRHQRILGIILLLLGGFILLRYLPAFGASFSEAPLPAEAVGDPAMFWTILLLDVGVVIPAAVASGLNLLAGGSEWARKAGYATVGWFVLVATSVAAMGIVMVLRRDPYAAPGMTLVFAAMAVAGIAAAVWLYRPLLAKSRRISGESVS